MTLYVRNESSTPITANAVGAKRFELSAKGNPGSTRVLPLNVAQLAGFQRVWAATPARITVATDAAFANVVTSIPASEGSAAAPATTSVNGTVKQGAAVAPSTATTVAGLVADHNALVASLKAAGSIA